MKSLFKRLASWLMNPEANRVDEAYLAEATDVCDLEHRMRQLDRRNAGIMCAN